MAFAYIGIVGGNTLTKGLTGIKITGDKAIDDMLFRMPIELERKILRSSLRKAAKPLRVRMRKNIPKDTRQAESTINVRASKRNRSLAVRTTGKLGIKVWTDPKRIEQIHQRISAFFNPHWLEYGVPGRQIRPQPWARPAIHQTKSVIFNIFRVEVAASLATTIASGKWTP